MADESESIRVDAKSFQHDLAWLTEAMVEKVFREGAKQVGWPDFAFEDFAMMLRYSRSVYNLMFYLNADERRKNDEAWTPQDGVTAMALVRSLIDCLYNITAILQKPHENGTLYRKSGIQKVLNDLEEDKALEAILCSVVTLPLLDCKGARSGRVVSWDCDAPSTRSCAGGGIAEEA